MLRPIRPEDLQAQTEAQITKANDAHAAKLAEENRDPAPPPKRFDFMSDAAVTSQTVDSLAWLLPLNAALRKDALNFRDQESARGNPALDGDKVQPVARCIPPAVGLAHHLTGVGQRLSAHEQVARDTGHSPSIRFDQRAVDLQPLVGLLQTRIIKAYDAVAPDAHHALLLFVAGTAGEDALRKALTAHGTDPTAAELLVSVSDVYSQAHKVAVALAKHERGIT